MVTFAQRSERFKAWLRTSNGAELLDVAVLGGDYSAELNDALRDHGLTPTSVTVTLAKKWIDEAIMEGH